MTALDPSSTARLYIDYTVGGSPRTIQLRRPEATDLTAVLSSFRSLLSTNVALFYTTTVFTGARYSNAGTNVTNPLAFDSLTGTGSGSQPVQDLPRFLSWVGRDSQGHKVRFYLYGTKPDASLPGDYRYTTGESTAVDTLQEDILDFIAELNVVTVNGLVPTMNDYTNTGFNAYHQRNARG